MISFHRNLEENTNQKNIRIQMPHFATDSTSTLTVIFDIFPYTILRWPNRAFGYALADAIKRVHVDWKYKHAIDSEIIYLLNAHTICAIFVHNWMQCIDSSSLYYYATNPAILRFFFVTEWTQLNAVHV